MTFSKASVKYVAVNFIIVSVGVISFVYKKSVRVAAVIGCTFLCLTCGYCI